MAALRGTLTPYNKDGSEKGSGESRLAGGAIVTTVNSWQVQIAVWLHRDGNWRITVSDLHGNKTALQASGTDLEVKRVWRPGDED